MSLAPNGRVVDNSNCLGTFAVDVPGRVSGKRIKSLAASLGIDLVAPAVNRVREGILITYPANSGFS